MALSWMAHRCTYPPVAWPQSPTSTLRARLFQPCRTRLHLRNHATAACGRFPHSTIAHRLVLRLSAGALAEQLLEDAIDFASSRAFTMSPMSACALHGRAAQTVNASKLSAAFNEKKRGEEGEPLDALGARPQSRLAPRLIRIRAVSPDQLAIARPGVHLPRARLQTSCANPLA